VNSASASAQILQQGLIQTCTLETCGLKAINIPYTSTLELELEQFPLKISH